MSFIEASLGWELDLVENFQLVHLFSDKARCFSQSECALYRNVIIMLFSTIIFHYTCKLQQNIKPNIGDLIRSLGHSRYQTVCNSFYAAISQRAWQTTFGTTCVSYGKVRAGSWHSSKMAKEIIYQMSFEQTHLMRGLKVTKYFNCLTLVVLQDSVSSPVYIDSWSESLI